MTNLLDDGSGGSLRWAVGQANMSAGNEAIDFDPTVFATPQTITLTSTPLELSNTSETETITGPAVGVTVSGGGQSRVFQIGGSVTASISGLTITGGNFRGYPGGGGGISNTGTLSLTHCTVSGNTASGYSGSGGGINNTGTLTLTHCTVSGNSASGDFGAGGGLANDGGTVTLTDCTVSGNSAAAGGIYGYGGGLANKSGTVTLTNCIVSGNSTGHYGEGDGIDNLGTATLTHCTVSGNSRNGIENQQGTATLTNCTISGNSGVGLDSNEGTTTLTDCTVSSNRGGGVVAFGTLTLTNCTVSGNSADSGGGLYLAFGTLTLTHCTVSGNSGTRGGGLFIGTQKMPLPVAVLHNTLIAGNVSGATGMTRDDVNGRLDPTSDYNLIGDGRGMTGIRNGVNGNLVGSAASPIDPLLGPLQDNGGPTQTMALRAGCPALDAGAPNQLGSTDQRGVVRSGGVNIGAYQASASAFVLTAPDTVTAGMPFDVTVTAVDSFGQLAVGYTGTVAFSTTDPDPNVVLPPDYAFTLADQGRHTFQAGFTLVTPGDQTLTRIPAPTRSPARSSRRSIPAPLRRQAAVRVNLV